MHSIYDIAVIGKGLFGTAAAKYLRLAGVDTILIGPNEPKEKEFNNAAVYASHYDEGRVTRIFSKSEDWTLLNQISQSKFHEIEKQSGISFYGTEGSLFVSPHCSDPHYEKVMKQVEKFSQHTIHKLTAQQLENRFPDFHFPAAVQAYLECGISGHLKPRKLIEAQMRIFLQNGGTHLSGIINCIIKKENTQVLFTTKGEEIKAKKVLLCTGAFQNLFDFGTEMLPMILKSEVILLAQVTEETAKSLQQLPSLLHDIKSEQYEDVYLVKPLQYPDRKYYLKMGANLCSDKFFTSLEEVKCWFCSEPSTQQKEILENILKELMPRLPVVSLKTKHCIIERTATGNPIIKKVSEHIYACTGGNGYGAMCSDAVGYFGALCAMDKDYQSMFSESFFG